MDEAERIAGYRVLRRIARGARSTVLLAHGGDPPESVVLKATGPGDPAAVREAAALDRGAGDHVVALLDAASDERRDVLVLPRLPGPDLAGLLAERGELAGGEAVTILAPIAATVRRLHDAGVAHGALGAGCVRFDADGAPVLTGFGSAVLFDAQAPEIVRERIDEVVRDRASVRVLAEAVLGRVGEPRRGAAQRLVAAARGIADVELLPWLASEVFAIAAAAPVRPVDSPAPAAGRGRAVPVAVPVPPAPGSEPRRWSERITGLLERAPGEELRAALGRRWSAWSAGRRRLVLAVGAGALALLVCLVAIPAAPAPGATVSPTAPHPRDGAPRSDSASASPSASRLAGTATGEGAVIRGDDPIAATTALLRSRASCRRILSVLCLDDVDQDGSAASDADRAAIRAAQAGGELGDDPLPSTDAANPALAERIGDSALVNLSGGASVLIVRVDGGWRIRSMLPPPGQTTTPSPRG
jgi:eukaryotic-like serine/threonine-protein kinase